MVCLFCAIIEGGIAAKVVYEDEFAVAFLDINPWHEGHTLVIPRRHVADVTDSPEGLSEISAAVHQVANLLKDRLGADGLNILSNAGEVAGQEVFHLHVHVIPRYRDNPGMAGLANRKGSRPLDEVHAALTQLS